MNRYCTPALLALVLGGGFFSSAAGQSLAPGFEYDKLQDEGVALLQQYIRINTSNPPGNEIETARFLHAVLDKEGIENQILDTLDLPAGRANFYARLKGDGSKKAIALVHHMDVVPVAREFWTVDAFAGTIKDGFLYGRGAIDMKGHGIIQLMAFIALKRAGVPLHRDIVLIGNADEETDGIGSRTFIRKHPDLLKNVEYLLTEGADTRVENGRVKWWGIDVGEKRPYWQKITVHGRTSHGSVPTPGNPVPRLARAVARLAAWQTEVRISPAVARYFKAQAPFETGQHRIWMADATAALKNPKARAWLLSDPFRSALLRNTVTPTVLTGSNKTNTIPNEASAEIDIRLLPDQDLAAFDKELRAVVADTAVHFQTIGDVPPRMDSPLNTDLFRVIEKVAGKLLPGVPVATPVSAGATDRPYYAGAGIICYGVDPYLIEFADNENGVHGNDERLALSNVGFGIKFYINTLIEAQ